MLPLALFISWGLWSGRFLWSHLLGWLGGGSAPRHRSVPAPCNPCAIPNPLVIRSPEFSVSRIIVSKEWKLLLADFVWKKRISSPTRKTKTKLPFNFKKQVKRSFWYFIIYLFICSLLCVETELMKVLKWENQGDGSSKHLSNDVSFCLLEGVFELLAAVSVYLRWLLVQITKPLNTSLQNYPALAG